MTEKQALHQHCQQQLHERLARVQTEIKAIQQSANEETKSSAGDKYETGRAMAQLELERLMTHLKETERLAATLQSINAETVCHRVQLGTLVRTNTAAFYISISLGNITCNNQKYFVISADSPIAKLMLGKEAGDSITWNGQTQIIKSIA